ncbi:3-oxo-tetronate kinase [Halomonas sp. AOP5-B2-8]
MGIVLGVIADDFTGATDIANTLVGEGVRVTQVIGMPSKNTDINDAEAVVIALKSRSSPVNEAIDQSLAALHWLRARGARQILFKYCSTFDSTPQGNIGPVADALVEALGGEFVFVCPAFPQNGRTIYKGNLFVGDTPLSESSMQGHPLTPMRDSNLMRLMAAQSRKTVGLIPLEVVRQGPEAISARMEKIKALGVVYGVIDALTDEDLRVIGSAAAGQPLVTGGSGVAMGLPANLREAGWLGKAKPPEYPMVSGRDLVLAGSCSVATRAQIARVKQKWPSTRINLDQLAAGDDVIEKISQWAVGQSAKTPVMIYASANPSEVKTMQERYGVAKAGEMVEMAMGDLARILHRSGFNRIVVAGGETSGAVVSALDVRALRIGPTIAPGVPWTEAVGQGSLAIALKSGNFGSDSFFEEAFAVLP